MALIPKCNLQERLESIYCTSREIDDVAMEVTASRAIISDVNSGRLQQKMLSENGQKMAVEMIWDTPDCTPVSEGCTTNHCADGARTVSQESQIETITCSSTNTIYDSVLFNLNDYREVLAAADGINAINAPLTRNGRGQSFEKALMDLVAKIDLAQDKKLVKFMVDSVNQTTFGFSPKEAADIPNVIADNGKAVKTYGAVAAGGVLNDLYTEARYSAKIAKYCADPILMGGHMLNQFIALNQGQCCSSDGLNMFDIYSQGKLPVIFSNHLVEYFASKYAGSGIKMNPYVLSYDKGSIQVINYAQNRGIFAKTGNDTLEKTTISSPYSGRTMDVYVYHDTCTEKVSLKVSVTEEYRLRPETHCATDGAYGVNGLQQLVIKN